MHINRLKLKVIILSTVLTVFIVTRALASDISAINFYGDLIGKVIPDGTVVNSKSEVIGRITADGYIFDDENSLVGGIVPQGVVLSYNNKVIGRVNNDGSVTAQNDALIGKVLPNGIVVNDNYDAIGSVISSGLVYNDLGGIVGRVSGDGLFYDLKGEKSGFISSNGYVYSSQDDGKYEVLGKLISSKIVVSFSGKLLGSITPDGKVTDLKKKIIGNIRANGYVYNKDGIIIGQLADGGYAFDFSGKYLGIISYNGNVINKGVVVAHAVDKNQVIDAKGTVIGFILPTDATANTLDGKFLGYLIPNGMVVKAKEVVGKISATGDVVDLSEKRIGKINKKGPIFDYLGRLKANSSVNGYVTNIDGSALGYMQKNIAFNYKGQEVGKILSSSLVFDNVNQYIGTSGISGTIVKDDTVYTISPYGYVFDNNGDIVGHSLSSFGVYTPKGNVLTYVSANGDSQNVALNKISKLDSMGNLIDKDNKVLGRIITDTYVTNFIGETFGYISMTNAIVDNKDKKIAKIIPDGSIANLSGNTEYNKKAGNSPISISINGEYLGYNTDQGEVKKEKQIVGKIGADSYVIDNMGSLYGKTLSLGVAITKECKFLGVVSENSTIKNYKNNYIGTPLANNQVVNDEGSVVGYIIYPSTIIGKKGEIIGTQNVLGNVLNYQAENLGCEDISGIIRNNQNEIIGRKVTYSTVMDFENKIIGHINILGDIVDNDGVDIASINIYEDVISNDDVVKGVLFKYNVAFDNNNIYLGRVNELGEVVSDSGNIIAKVNYQGEVLSKDVVIGYALYDLYVYDNENNTVGYITKNGHVYGINGNNIGTVYKGFVLDKRNNLIARGRRDYNVRDSYNKTIGLLLLNGSVVNDKNIKIGDLAENGDVWDSNNQIIAKANYLQYYKYPAKPTNADNENEYGIIIDEQNNQVNQNGRQDYKEDNESIEENKQGISLEEKELISQNTTNPNNLTNIGKEPQKKAEVIKTRLQHERIGIAVTPSGSYIGDIYDNNKVIDEEGSVVGSLNENGEIVDSNGEVIGTSEKDDTPQKATNQKSKSNWLEVIKGTTISPHSIGNEITNVGPGGGIGPGGRYNPQRAAILSQLHQERRRTLTNAIVNSGYNAESYTGWQDDWGIAKQISTLRVDMNNMITADKPIPAVLARSLISLGSTPITAIVERNIYGDSGRNVVIPAGSRVIGGLQEIGDNSRFDATSGGVKIEISWERIIRPDGISFFINSSQTGDAQGRGGGALGYVDEQLVKKYTLPIVGTMVTSAITYMMAADEESTGEIENSKQEAASDARQQFMERMDEILQEIIDSKKEIQPVTYVPAGTRIIIYPMTDLWLRTTKDIDKGASSIVPTNVSSQLVTSDGNSSNQTTTVTTGGQSQTVIKGGNQQVNSQQDANFTPLVADNGSNTNNQQVRNNRALPPVSADGTEIGMPYEEQEEDTSGEIDLSF